MYVSSPVRRLPSTSASTTTSGSVMRSLAGRRRQPRRRHAPTCSGRHAPGRAERARPAPVGGLDPRGDRRDVERVDEDGRVADDLLHRAAGARHDGRAARHRLERGNAEALVERREDEAARAAVGGGQLVVLDPAEPGDVLPGDACVPPAGRADEPQLHTGAGRGLDDAGEVLAGLERPDSQHVLALGSAAVGDERPARARSARRRSDQRRPRLARRPPASRTPRPRRRGRQLGSSDGAQCARRAASRAGRPPGAGGPRGRARSGSSGRERGAARGRSCSAGRRRAPSRPGAGAAPDTRARRGRRQSTGPAHPS